MMNGMKLKLSKQRNLNPFLKLEDLSHAFASITNIDEALALFHHMLQMKPTPSTLHYNNLFTTIAKTQHYSHVVKMFKKLILLKTPVNEYTMNIIIHCYANLQRVHLGFPIIANSLKMGYSPNIVTINCLLQGLFLTGEVAKAVGLFKHLILSKLCVFGAFDEYTVATVLNGLAKSGNVGYVVELFRIAEENNWKLDVACYTIVIDALCKGGMLRDATEVLFRMVGRGVPPNVVTYTSYIHGLCMNGRLDFACSVFNGLASKGVCPNVITYTVIIQGLCREGIFRDAIEVLEKMERLGCFPNYVTYNVIVQACLQHLNSFDSVSLLKQVVGRDFQLNAPSFFVILRQMQVLRGMKGVYDDDVINQLIRKLVSSDAIHLMRDRNDELMITCLMQKLNSSDS